MRDELLALVAAQDLLGIRNLVREMHPAETSSFITALAPGERALVFRLLEKDKAIAVFENLNTEDQQELLQSLRSEEIIHIMENMSPDDRVRLLDEVPAKVARKMLQLLSPAEREVSSLLLGYPPRTAGRIMTTDYVTLHEDMLVEAALERIRQTGLDKETIYTCYVTDHERRLVGVVTLRELVLADRGKSVGELMSRRVIAVQTTDDQEKAARLVKEYDFLALPVVDSENRLVGIVTVDDILDVLEEESSEDFQLIGAVSLAPARTGRYFGAAWWEKLTRRLPWLLVLILAETVSAGIISAFESFLSTAVFLAFFIPLLMSTTGNAGSQMITLTVRSLATGEIDPKKFTLTLAQETATGLLLGLTLGVVGMVMSLALGGTLEVATVVGLTMVATITTAQALGVFLPYAFRWLRLDPAIASAPLIATVSDILTLLLYFHIARLILGL